MSAQHTRGMLEVHPSAMHPAIRSVGYGLEKPRRICTVGSMNGSSIDEANARRLVACWNACEGISTEALERGPLSEAFEREQDRADSAGRQRDELLAVLHMALPALEAMRKQWPRIPLDDSMDVVEVVRAAIAKVEGGAE